MSPETYDKMDKSNKIRNVMSGLAREGVTRHILNGRVTLR
jgi:hypothetical protein